MIYIEEIGFQTALTELFQSNTELIQLWNSASITGEKQEEIDASIRQFIAQNTELTTDKQIIPRMPFTQLTLAEMDIIDKIIESKVGDLWRLAFYEGGISVLSDNQRAQLQTLGNELLTSPSYQTYFDLSKTLDQTQ